MLIGRFLIIVPILAIAGSLAAKKTRARLAPAPSRRMAPLVRRPARRRRAHRRRPDLPARAGAGSDRRTPRHAPARPGSGADCFGTTTMDNRRIGQPLRLRHHLPGDRRSPSSSSTRGGWRKPGDVRRRARCGAGDACCSFATSCSAQAASASRCRSPSGSGSRCCSPISPRRSRRVAARHRPSIPRAPARETERQAARSRRGPAYDPVPANQPRSGDSSLVEAGDDHPVRRRGHRGRGSVNEARSPANPRPSSARRAATARP